MASTSTKRPSRSLSRQEKKDSGLLELNESIKLLQTDLDMYGKLSDFKIQDTFDAWAAMTVHGKAVAAEAERIKEEYDSYKSAASRVSEFKEKIREYANAVSKAAHAHAALSLVEEFGFDSFEETPGQLCGFGCFAGAPAVNVSKTDLAAKIKLWDKTAAKILQDMRDAKRRAAEAPAWLQAHPHPGTVNQMIRARFVDDGTEEAKAVVDILAEHKATLSRLEELRGKHKKLLKSLREGKKAKMEE